MKQTFSGRPLSDCNGGDDLAADANLSGEVVSCVGGSIDKCKPNLEPESDSISSSTSERLSLYLSGTAIVFPEMIFSLIVLYDAECF